MNVLLKLLKKPSLIGLDIQSDGLTLLQLSKARHVFRIDKLAKLALPLGVIVEGKIKQSPILTRSIRQLVQLTKTHTSRVAIALSAQSVIQKRIKLPAVLHEKECAIELDNRLSHYLPGVVDELCFDFAIHGKDTWHYDISLVAARREQLDAHVKMINQSGVTVKVVDIDAYALMRAVNFFISPEASQMNAVLDFRQTEVLFIVYQKNQVVLNYYFPLLKNPFEFSQQVKHALQLYFSNYQDAVIHYYVSGCSLEMFTCLQQELHEHITEINVNKELDSNESTLVTLTLMGLAMRGIG